MGWYALSGAILVLGALLIVVSRDPQSAAGSAPGLDDHWHAAFGVDVCGSFLPNEPEFHDAEGLHTHGDGLLHFHPDLSRATGDRATLGLYFDLAKTKANKNSFEMWDAEKHETGDKCADKKAEVRWALNGEEQDDNISDYRVQDGDRITLALLPKDDPIPDPPSTAELAAPQDLQTEGAVPQTAPPVVVTAPADPSATTLPADTAPTTAGGTTAPSSP
jgi:hypothetical protein